MRALILAFSLLILPARAQPTPEALAMAREMVAEMGIEEQIDATMQQMRSYLLQTMRAQSPRVPEATLVDVLDNFILVEVRAQAREVTDATILIWAGRASVDDMRAMRDFQRSETGQRIRAVMPVVTTEMVRFTQAWGQRVVTNAINKHRETLRARGIIL